MPRTASRERLESIARAATEVFGRVGYQRTRTADVAAAAGVSAGSLFTYVQTKDALFHLVFAYGFGQLGDAVSSLPLANPERGETLALIEKELRNIPAPKLRAALKTEAPADVAGELRGIIGERYDIIEARWPILAVIERCAVDLPELEDFYYGRVRVGYQHRLARYLEQRSRAGYLRAMPDAVTASRLISESIAWFAWHRREGRDAHESDDDTARRTVIEFVCAALIPEQRP
jgi:AcrR family transcriptional regulator